MPLHEIEAQILNGSITLEERTWFRIGVGQRFLNIDQGNVTTYFKANPFSPYDDRVHKEINPIRKSNLVRLDYQFEVGYAHPFGLSHALMLDVCVENNFAFAGGYSLGWEFSFDNMEYINIRPALAILLSNTKYDIGQLDIINDSYYSGNGFIQIGGNSYFTDQFDIYLSQDNLSLLYGPQLHLNFLIKNSVIGLHCSAAYYFNKNFGDTIVVFEPDKFADNEQVTAVSTNSSRLDVVYNDAAVVTGNFPFHFGGFSAVVGLTFNL